MIIDTDPGVDDAFALLFAMRSPELKIEGITPVAGNVPLEFTLPNALRMVEIAGRTDIPVAAGASAPLERRLVTATYAHGENGLGGAVFPEPKTKPIADPAAVFIRHIVRKYPGEVTLITLGPQTNVATALASDPGLAKLIKAVVMMGGSLSGGNVTPPRSSTSMWTRKRRASYSSRASRFPWWAWTSPARQPLPKRM